MHLHKAPFIKIALLITLSFLTSTFAGSFPLGLEEDEFQSYNRVRILVEKSDSIVELVIFDSKWTQKPANEKGLFIQHAIVSRVHKGALKVGDPVTLHTNLLQEPKLPKEATIQVFCFDKSQSSLIQNSQPLEKQRLNTFSRTRTDPAAITYRKAFDYYLKTDLSKN